MSLVWNTRRLFFVLTLPLQDCLRLENSFPFLLLQEAETSRTGDGRGGRQALFGDTWVWDITLVVSTSLPPLVLIFPFDVCVCNESAEANY